MKSLVALVAALTFGPLLVTGCQQTICLRVTDATNNQPLPGVAAVWREDSAINLLTDRWHQTGPTNMPPSSDNGVITITQVHEKWFSRFILSHSGYATTYGIYYRGTLNLAQRIKSEPLPQDIFLLEQPITKVGATNGYFTVPLPRSAYWNFTRLFHSTQCRTLDPAETVWN